MARIFLATLTIMTALFSVHNAEAVNYTVDNKASQIAFSGTHAGQEFKGHIETWQAEIAFDPTKLADSHLKAIFQADSAKTGNPMYDGTLPQADWLNSKVFPQIEFVSQSIKENTDKSYSATGDLTIRGVTHPADLTFTLSDLAQKPVTATGHLTIDRLSYDIGKKSDGKAEWVSKDIIVTIKIVANPKN